MQGVIGNLVGICITVKSHLVQAFSGFIKSFLHQDNLTIFGLSIQFRVSQSGFTVFNDIFISFMDHSELSIKPFRLLVDISQKVLKGHFVLVWFFFFIAIYHNGRVSVRFSSFGSFRFLPLMGLATRARNIVQSGHCS